MDDLSPPLLLKRLDAARNMARFYGLSIEPSLFAGSALLRSWGRIGTKGRSRVVLYGDVEEARAALERLAAAKLKRGYRPA
ncbi:WGR domain-containing protein [Rhizobium sp. RAF56]|uniref:WGR domain-containing protein n=1 Tax=Rhizobium sp. RAF56 TaxID=3233062 RepID=UPI003F9DCBC0